MGFATSFLAGAQLRQQQQDQSYRALQSLMARRPTGVFGAAPGGAGGDPLSRIRDIERQREASEMREAQTALLAQHTGIAQEQLEQARQQSQIGRALMHQQGIAPVGTVTQTGMRALSDEELREQQAAETAEAFGRATQAQLEVPAVQVQEAALAGQAEAATRGVIDQQRETARKSFIDAYANRDAEAMQRHWSGMFPGADFKAKFRAGPQGQPLIQFPGSDEWEVFDHGMFRQFAIYGANQALEAPTAGAAMPGVAAMAGAEQPAVAEARAPAAGMKPPTWKEFQDVVGGMQRIQTNRFDAARKYADSKVPLVDEMTGKPLEGAEEKWQQAFNEGLGIMNQNANLRAGGDTDPMRGMTKSQINMHIDQASNQWNQWLGEQRDVDPANWYKTLENQFGPKVAIGWAMKDAPSLARAARPMGQEQLFEQYGVRLPEREAGPMRPESDIAISPEQVMEQQQQPQPILASTGEPLSIGGNQLLMVRDPGRSPQILINDPNTGQPRPVNEQDLAQLGELARVAPDSEKGLLGALMGLISQANRRLRAMGAIKTYPGGVTGVR